MLDETFGDMWGRDPTYTCTIIKSTGTRLTNLITTIFIQIIPKVDIPKVRILVIARLEGMYKGII